MHDTMQYCTQPGCSVIVARGRCPKHALDRESLRPNLAVRRWYRLPRWRTLRAQVLREEPICHGQEGACGRPTTDVDHRVPHDGDPARFWDRRNLQGLCHGCHTRKTQLERPRGARL